MFVEGRCTSVDAKLTRQEDLGLLVFPARKKRLGHYISRPQCTSDHWGFRDGCCVLASGL